jgi:tRNA pseudouridine38-40 synthase
VGKLFKKEWVPVIGCSRTDAGVHAEQFFANFKVDKYIEPYKVLKALNGLLPYEIAVKDVKIVDLSFNARFSAKGKIYKYLIWNEKVRNPFLLNRAWHIPFELNLKEMEKTAKLFEGTNNFTAFSKNEEGRNPIITVEYLQITKQQGLIEIRIKASHFLRYMVRRIVGTLVEVGMERITGEEVKRLLNEGGTAPYTAKPYGLYLHRVFY